MNNKKIYQHNLGKFYENCEYCKYCNFLMTIVNDGNNGKVYICEKCGHIKHIDDSFKRLCTCDNCKLSLLNHSKRTHIYKYDYTTKSDLLYLIEHNNNNSISHYSMPVFNNVEEEKKTKSILKRLLSNNSIEIDYDNMFDYQIENTRFKILDVYESIFRFNVDFLVENISSVNKQGYYKEIFTRSEALYHLIELSTDNLLRETIDLFEQYNMPIDITNDSRKEITELFHSFSYIQIYSRLYYSRFFYASLIKTGKSENYIAKTAIMNACKYLKNNTEKLIELDYDPTNMVPLLDKFGLDENVLFSPFNEHIFYDYKEFFDLTEVFDEPLYQDRE